MSQPLERVRLLVRFDATQNPNRQDYLMRLAEANSLSGIAGLSRIFHASYSELVSLDSYSFNELIAGERLVVQNDYSNSEVRRGGPFLRRRGWAKEARVCPSCLKEGKLQSVCFNFSIPLVCPHHGLLPLDFCPNCGIALSYARTEIQRCDCGYLLAKAHGLEKPEWLTGFYAIFSPWHLIHVGPNYNLAEYVERDWRAARLVQFILKGFRRTTPTMYVTTADFDNIGRLITDWPAGIWRNLPFPRQFGRRRSSMATNFETSLLRSNWILNQAVTRYEEYRR